VKADVYGVPVRTVQSEEAGLTGAMILAAVGAGAYQSAAEGAAALVQFKGRFAPQPTAVAAYNRIYPVFKRLHDDIQPLFKAVAAIT
jgi:xylulokinase